MTDLHTPTTIKHQTREDRAAETHGFEEGEGGVLDKRVVALDLQCDGCDAIDGADHVVHREVVVELWQLREEEVMRAASTQSASLNLTWRRGK